MDAENLDADALKHKKILKAAFDSFAVYGFRRTSMDDIAKAAGMSRPALYLHFRNKEDIFRNLAQHYNDSTARDLADALREPGSPEDVIERGLLAQGGQIKEIILTSPHGHELLDTGSAICADVIEDGWTRNRVIWTKWLAAERTAGRIGFDGPANEMAETILLAWEGIKHPPYETYLRRLHQLADLLGRGLRP